MEEGVFAAPESERLVLMDRRDFDSTGYGLDDLIEAYVQTVSPLISPPLPSLKD